MGVCFDYISNLQDNLTETILLRLPLREAVQTSVLSTKWRYKWASLPKLEFNEECFIHFHTPLLSTVSIFLPEWTGDDRSGKLVELFHSLPHIEYLNTGGYFLEHLGVDNVPVGVPVSDCLKFLSVDVDFRNPKEVMAVICILQWSPNLEELEMNVFEHDNGNYPEGVNHLSFSFEKLGLIKLNGISGLKSKLDFIEMLLASSVVLKKMAIKQKVQTLKMLQPTFALGILQKLVRLPRASKLVEIIYDFGKK
ncbi:hypothetical protein GIB67_031522 [Kingdonia uniflora]|uniref:F-box domain-containing protein n=1 Tax=Kingdonia uniflora TaxID=39325 RepID=A0A7J7MNF1_9MAGN|nr:hypothetical protein GIB67_031522 [Kingdonia uniflora]